MPAKPGPLRPHETPRRYQRPQIASPPPGEPAVGDSFLIVTEGKVTEFKYLEQFRKRLKARARVIHSGRTDALGLVRAAVAERDAIRNDTQAGNQWSRAESWDHVWVVFDSNVSAREGQLTPALSLARSENVHVALSTPCFEFWLLLHFRRTTGPLLEDRDANTSLQEAWGRPYDKSKMTFDRLCPDLVAKIPAAVANADAVRQHHKNASSSDPANPSTEVDKLIWALNDSVRPEFRLLGKPSVR